RNGRSNTPANGSQRSTGCAHAGSSGSGTTIPDSIDTAAPLSITMPSLATSHTSVTLISVDSAHTSASPQTSAAANPAPDASDAGGPSRHSPRPISGKTSVANTTIGAARR